MNSNLKNNEPNEQDLKDIIAEKEEIIKKLENELELSKQKNNLDIKNPKSNKNELDKLIGKNNELLNQNNKLQTELKMKEKYIQSLNATILRLKNNIEIYNKSKDKYEDFLNEKNELNEKINLITKKNLEEKELMGNLKQRNEDLNKTNEGLALQIKKYKLEIKNLQNLSNEKSNEIEIIFFNKEKKEASFNINVNQKEDISKIIKDLLSRNPELKNMTKEIKFNSSEINNESKVETSIYTAGLIKDLNI